MTDEPSDPIIEALWERALASWNDEKIHAALLDHALRNERLPDVAGRYRALLDDPEKGPLAKKRIDAIVLSATQLMMATKSEPRRKAPGWLTAVAALVCAVLISLLTYALVFRR